ncbi:MAG: uL15 family ribosomal protein [Clostridia bacterium]|nr:uL15 family ribosomal protein [Clostridia bacterium]
MANKIKSYVGALLKGTNLFACIIASLVVAALVYACDAFNLIASLTKLPQTNWITLVSVLGLGALLLAVLAIKGLFSKSIGITDSLLTIGAFGMLWALVYVLTTVSAGSVLNVYKWAVFGALVAIVLLFFLVRINKCDGSIKQAEDVPPANATFASYYKAFFKRYFIVSIIYAIVVIAGVILLDKANFVSSLFKGENALLGWGIVGLVAALFLALLVARIGDRDIDATDVVVFQMLVAGLMLFAAIFMVGKGNKLLVGLFATVVLLVAVISSVLLIKNTHIETQSEEKAYAQGENGFKAYVKAFVKHVNPVAVISTALLMAGVIIALSATGFVGNVIELIHTEQAVINTAIFVGLAFIFALIATDVKLHRIETADIILVALAIIGVVTLITDYIVLKAPFVPGGVAFIIISVLSISLIAVRTIFVKLPIEVAQVAPELVEKEEAPAQQAEAVELTPVEETPAQEVAVTAAAEEISAPLTEEVALEDEVPEKLKRITVKKSYEIYLRTGDDQLKENYSALKNEFLSYGLHARMTKSRENFSKKGLTMSKAKPEKALRLQAKLLVRGKFLKLYLNVDPANLDAKYFRIKDVSAKYPDQATYIKIRSKLSLKRAIELIALLAEKEGFKKKKKFEAVDYKQELGSENLSYMQTLGYDYMVKDSVSYAEVVKYKDDWAERVVKTKLVPDAERYIYDEVTLDDISKAFKDGEVVDLEALRVKGLVKINANYVTVKPSAHLTKKLFVEANVIDEKAIQMIAIAGGEATRLIFE